jgi:alpha-beta hydrolase superfamily lysophospholipase
VQPDVLGTPYEQFVIELGEDDEGPVVATLVRRRAGAPTRRAVLSVHGYVDYFFHTHVADFYTARGFDFYAIDLRKYGRSLREYQTPNFARSLTEYFPELDKAVRIITADGHDSVLVTAHSTGGLITPLWAHARRDSAPLAGLFLNSPFFDLNAPWLLRRPGAAAAAGLGRLRPYQILPLGVASTYGHSLHIGHHGEWDYDLAWKPIGGFPVRAGWLRAIRDGQQRLHAGLDIRVPILVASSAESYRGSTWSPEAMRRDAVLDVAHMSRWAPGLGRHVTVVRIDGGLHDLTLSASAVRAELFSELDRWLEAYVAGAAPAGMAPTPPAAGPTGAS